MTTIPWWEDPMRVRGRLRLAKRYLLRAKEPEEVRDLNRLVALLEVTLESLGQKAPGN